LAKQIWKPSTMLNPVPVVMVSCSDSDGKPNIITLAWAGTINSDPPMVSISVRKQRYSYELIKQKGQFVINLPTRNLTFATDFCGVKSGKDVDKFAEMKLTPESASKVEVPLIRECPVNLECIVRQVIELGSHDLFLAEVVATNVDEKLLDENGKLDLHKAELICYSHGEYYPLGASLGYFGYSVTRRKNLKRNQNITAGKKPSENLKSTNGKPRPVSGKHKAAGKKKNNHSMRN
jgi:flavin reductase (DIM6/NTAB) family NADH-FMN oxidoreductase RutF